MLANYKKKFNILLAIGLPLAIVGTFVFPSLQSIPSILTALTVLTGHFFFFLACRALAIAKGYKGIIGLFFALFFIVGLFGLLLLKDKTK